MSVVVWYSKKLWSKLTQNIMQTTIPPKNMNIQNSLATRYFCVTTYNREGKRMKIWCMEKVNFLGNVKVNDTETEF